MAAGRFRQVRPGRDASRCRASRSSPAPTCTATGSRSRTSPSSTRPTSPISRRSARPTPRRREKQGFKLTMLAFLIKACVTALRQFPEFNASLDPGGEPGAEEVLPHRRRRRHARRPGRAGGQGRRQQGRVRSGARDGRDCEAGARQEAQARRHAGRNLLDLQPGRHRRHALSRPSSTRRRSRSSACRDRRCEPVWDGKASSCRG